MFRQPENEDLDVVVNKFYLIMIDLVSEVQHGIENMWMRGKSNRRINHPRFGKHTSRNYLKTFPAAAPSYFSDKNWWCVGKDAERRTCSSLNWKVQQKRIQSIKFVLLILDELMPGYIPKTSE